MSADVHYMAPLLHKIWSLCTVSTSWLKLCQCIFTALVQALTLYCQHFHLCFCVMSLLFVPEACVMQFELYCFVGADSSSCYSFTDSKDQIGYRYRAVVENLYGVCSAQKGYSVLLFLFARCWPQVTLVILGFSMNEKSSQFDSLN